MKTLMTLLIAGAVATACFGLPATAQSKSKDEAKIRALEEQLRTAVIARDVSAVMKVYVPGQSLVVFDVIPPRQYVGADAYRKDWEGFLAFLAGRSLTRSAISASRPREPWATATASSASVA